MFRKSKEEKTDTIDLKKQAIRHFKGWIILMVLMLGADSTLIHVKSSRQNIIGAFIVTLFFGVCGFVAVSRFYRDYLKPSRTLEKTGDSTMERRMAEIKKRPNGKDIYDILTRYRRDHFIAVGVILGIVAFMFSVLMALYFNKDDIFHIPYYLGLIVGVVIAVVYSLIAPHLEHTFPTASDLKAEIQRKGYDEMQVNNDFMSATYHPLLKGLMAIGLNYYVVFSDVFCCVSPIRDISTVIIYSETETVQQMSNTRYYIRLIDTKHRVRRILCQDRIARDLMAEEFSRLGIEVYEEGDSPAVP